jgi:outer membrane lipopolysaccharide assembly protein LptE/RlpB
MLAKDMQRDMVASIMRRIDAALQATGPAGTESLPPSDTMPEAPAQQPADPSAPPPTH